MAKHKRANELPDFIESQKRRSKRDIDQWQGALRQAESITNPVRTQLYDIYDDVMLDGHLTSEIQKRVTALKGTGFNLFDTDGKNDSDKTDLFETPWFFEFLEEALNSIFWGHSLIQLKGYDDQGHITNIKITPRRHVIPEKGIIINKLGDVTGINFREDKKYSPWLVEVGKEKELGILNKATPHVLYKRFALGAWAEFTEIFGMPIRVGKTESRDSKMRNDMADMLTQMGTSGWAVIDKDDDLEFLESSIDNGDVYSGLMNFTNAEVSKLVNGAVIGEASNGGSRSKEEVGLAIQQLIGLSDLQLAEGIINHRLIPKLIEIGYDLEGWKLKFDRPKNLTALWEMVSGMLSNGLEIDIEWITETFGIPVTGVKQKNIEATANTPTSFFG